jgi:hypothetical protein
MSTSALEGVYSVWTRTSEDEVLSWLLTVPSASIEELLLPLPGLALCAAVNKIHLTITNIHLEEKEREKKQLLLLLQSLMYFCFHFLNLRLFWGSVTFIIYG